MHWWMSTEDTKHQFYTRTQNTWDKFWEKDVNNVMWDFNVNTGQDNTTYEEVTGHLDLETWTRMDRYLWTHVILNKMVSSDQQFQFLWFI